MKRDTPLLRSSEKSTYLSHSSASSSTRIIKSTSTTKTSERSLHSRSSLRSLHSTRPILPLFSPQKLTYYLTRMDRNLINSSIYFPSTLISLNVLLISSIRCSSAYKRTSMKRIKVVYKHSSSLVFSINCNLSITITLKNM
jgi:hypothetical protein